MPQDALITAAGVNIKLFGTVLRMARLDAETFHFASDPASIITALRNRQERIDLFTFLQTPASSESRYPYLFEWDNLAVLPVTTYENWWTSQIGTKVRNKARQAHKKGVIIQDAVFSSTLVQGIWEIYNETPVRQGRTFPHYGKSLDTIYKEASTYPDCSLFAGAYLEQELIGFIKLVIDPTWKQAGLMHILSKKAHQDKSPANALIAHAVQMCADRGIPRLVYANFSYGSKQCDGLSSFKAKNGFVRTDLPRYYVPLTHYGSLALQLGLHHSWKDHIPAKWADAYRNGRRAWYDFRNHAPVSADAR